MNERALARFHEVDWNDDGDIAAFVNRSCEEKRSHRSAFEKQAIVNTAWYMGMQSLFYDPQSQSLVRPAQSRKRVRLIYNLIMPYADQQTASLGAQQVNFEVWPATDDQADAETAEVATDVLRYYQDKLLWAEIEEELDLYAVLTGEAYCKVCWDALAGDPIDVQRLLGEERAQRWFSKRRKQDAPLTTGDLDVYAVSPLAIYWGAPGSKFENADWVIELNERTIAETAQRYGVDADELSRRRDDRRELYRLDDITRSGLTQWHDDTQETCVTVELWLKRSAALPQGGHFVLCGDKVLKKGPNPYRHGHIPYVRYSMAIVPGRNTGESYVTQLIGPQSDYNKNMSQQVEIREAMASPYILAPKGAIVNPAQWNGLAGGVREFAGPTPPMVVPGSGVPSSTMLALKQTESVMQDIIGAHDVTRAKVPTGVKSGRAIGLLQEKDEQRLARVRRRRSKAFARVGHMMLATAAQYVTEERLIKVTSEEDTFRARRFIGGDLIGGSDGPGVSYYDVRVSAEGMPVSRSAQLDVIELLLQYKALDPARPEDKAVIQQALNLGNVRRRWDTARKDRQQAQYENAELMQGRRIAPRSFDNHEQHLREHNEFRKSGFFRYAPPETQLLFEQHEREHMRLMARQALLPLEIMAEVRKERGLPMPPPPGQPTEQLPMVGAAAAGA